ncbi:MAG TPA: heavy metal transport/detoxification protein [Planctomycetaceae bacterium]|nr:heavy metal transport/detoxification protein [Planctomycetaceae bacterium]
MNHAKHKQSFLVSGMTCGHCKAAVESAIIATDGVEAAQVDLNAGNATAEGTFADTAVIASIKEAGYEAKVSGGN